MFSRCGVFSFKMLSTFRRTTNTVLCMLVLQNCQSSLNITSDSDELPAAVTSVLGLHARGKNRSLIAEPSAPLSTSEPLNLSTISPAAVASQIQQEVSRAQSHTPSSMVPSDTAIQPTEMRSQNAFRAFATYSGEQVVFKQIGDQWHAEVQSNVYKSQRMLPVVSTAPIGSFLSWLQKQDARTSKSRIHILNASYPHHNCCVYLGKMGLLGGIPASEEKKTKWVIGPSITLGSNSTQTEVHNIPPGYCYKGYRVKEGSIIQGASCTIRYVEAQSLEEINKLAECTNGGELEAKLLADFVNVVTLGKLEESTQHSVSKAHQDMQAPGCMYAALVVHGDTKTNRPFHEENQIRLELEVEVKEVDTKPPYIASLSALSSPGVGQVIDSTAFSGHEFAMQSGGLFSQSNHSDHPSVVVTSPYVDHPQTDSRAPASPFPLGTEGSPMSVNSYHSPVILSSLSLEEKEIDISSPSIQALLIECMQQSPLMAFGSPMSVNSHHSSAILTSPSFKEGNIDMSSESMQTLLIECMQQLGDQVASIAEQRRLVEEQLMAQRLDFTKKQSHLRAEMARSEADHDAQIRKIQEEYDMKFRKEEAASSQKKLSEEEREKQQAKQSRLRREYEKKLSKAEQDKCLVRADYEAMLQSQKETQSSKERELQVQIKTFEQQQAQAEANRERIRQAILPSIAFGASAWKKYYGEVGEEPRLPDNIEDILNSPCPFWKGSTVRDTHLLVLIPAKVNDQPFSLNLLRELMRQSRSSEYEAAEYSYYGEKTQQQIGATYPQTSYWLLMTRDVLPRSRNENYEVQKKLVADYARRKHFSYRLPQALEVATAILTHYVRSGERLYADNPWTYTRCQELVSDKSDKYPAVVGGFGSSGLFVDYCNHGKFSNFGVAGCRVF